MKNFYFALGIVFTLIPSYVLGAEAGMPQLNPEFWISQIFWLTLERLCVLVFFAFFFSYFPKAGVHLFIMSKKFDIEFSIIMLNLILYK